VVNQHEDHYLVEEFNSLGPPAFEGAVFSNVNDINGLTSEKYHNLEDRVADEAAASNCQGGSAQTEKNGHPDSHIIISHTDAIVSMLVFAHVIF
jgi:hypothetical protein